MSIYEKTYREDAIRKMVLGYINFNGTLRGDGQRGLYGQCIG